MERSVKLPADTQSQCQVWAELPTVLCVEIGLVRISVDLGTSALSVSIRDAQKEIQRTIAGGEITSGPKTISVEGEIAAVAVKEWIVDVKSAALKSKLQ